MPTPTTDTRPAQAVRVADFLERHPGATCKEIDAAADVGSITKVLSDMPALGYGLAKDWRTVACVGGIHTRPMRSYRLLHRPGRQPDLFDSVNTPPTQCPSHPHR
jgi:hypothetical protein